MGSPWRENHGREERRGLLNELEIHLHPWIHRDSACFSHPVNVLNLGTGIGGTCVFREADS